MINLDFCRLDNILIELHIVWVFASTCISDCVLPELVLLLSHHQLFNTQDLQKFYCSLPKLFINWP